MRMKTGALALAALLAGCSTSGSASPPPQPATPTTSASATSAPRPTPTGWTIAEAGEQYHQIAESVRAETRTFNRAYMADPVGMDALRKACADLGKASDDAMRLLDVGQWPADVRPAIDKVIENYAAQVASMQSCKAAKSLQAMILAAGEPVPNEGAGQVARVKLGLPPAVQDG